MSLRLYNTLSRRVEEFAPRDPGKVAMYACGPTVHDHAHIGNFRTFLFTDLLYRYLQFQGYDVTFAMNITDVDDKTIAKSRAREMSLGDYADIYEKIFFDDCRRLNIEPATIYPRATAHIPEMVEIVQELIRKKHAYEVDGSYFYRIESFPSYGQFARLNKEALRTGERVATDKYDKENVRDFALWKAYEEDDGDVFWETPLGKGRPGWHLECSAMSLKYLGEDFDIHIGGVDLIFPHHQNEIAQTEGVTGKRQARFWVHSEHLLVDGVTMSKSLGNFYTLNDLVEKGWTPREIRYALLGAHYRQQLNFTMASLEAARSSLERLDCCVRNLHNLQGSGGVRDVEKIIRKHEDAFVASMNDDLNYPQALASLFNLVRDVNSLCAADRIGPDAGEKVLESLTRFNRVLGFLELDVKEECDERIECLVRARDDARREKKWAEADRIRDELAALDIVLEDRAGGTIWRRKV